MTDSEAVYVFTGDMAITAVLCRYNGIEEAEELLFLPEGVSAWALVPMPHDALPRGAYSISHFLESLNPQEKA